MSGERMPALADAELSPAQKTVLAELVSGRRGACTGPFPALLRSPELMTHLQRAGGYLRYASSLAPPLVEMTVLMVARQWDQAVEWALHEPLARSAGVSAAAVDDLGAGRRPGLLPADEAAVWDLVDEITRLRTVGDATYRRAVGELGEQGVIEVLGTVGYYTTLAMIMNACRTAVPDGPVLP